MIEPLTRLRLAEEGQELDEETRAALTRELVEALRVDVPVLKGLKASELVTADVVLDNRLWLKFQLAETPRQLLESDRARRRQFLDEVRKAREQIESVEWRILEAIGEGRAPGDGVRDNEDESSTRAIRERVRRHERGGQLLIPGVPIGRRIEVGALPSVLARGPRLRISARVASMTRTRAKLTHVLAVPVDAARAHDIPGFQECDELERDLAAGHAALGEALRQAMAAPSRVELDVIVALDWASGTAVRFKQC